MAEKQAKYRLEIQQVRVHLFCSSMHPWSLIAAEHCSIAKPRVCLRLSVYELYTYHENGVAIFLVSLAKYTGHLVDTVV